MKIIVKRYGVINGLIFIFISFALLLKPFDSKADIEPFYNISVKIDPATTAYLNEKIEVYCEKDGHYFMIIDLNNNNQYEYKTALQNGIYTFQARVRYDLPGEYKVLPDLQTVELTYNNNHVLNEIVFTIEGISAEPDDHVHIDSDEDAEIQEERIYTVDDMEELQAMQESAVSEAEEAFAEREEWERNHNFLIQYGVLDQKMPTVQPINLPMHDYPESEGEDEEETEKLESESETLVESLGQSTDSGEEDGTSNHIMIFGVITVILLFILILLFIINGVKKRNRDE